MKRIFSVLIATVIAFCFTACAGTGTVDTLNDKADGIMGENENTEYAYAIQLKSNIKLNLFLKSDYSVAYSHYYNDETKQYFTEDAFENLTLSDAFGLILDKTKPDSGSNFEINITEVTAKAGSATDEAVINKIKSAFEDEASNRKLDLKCDVKRAKTEPETIKTSPLDG